MIIPRGTDSIRIGDRVIVFILPEATRRWSRSLPEVRGRLSLGDVLHLVATILLGVALSMVASAGVAAMLGDGSWGALLLSALTPRRPARSGGRLRTSPRSSTTARAS